MSTNPQPVTPAVNGWNAEYLDEQYTLWKRDPSLVAEDLASFFEGFDLASARPAAAGAPTAPSGSDALIGGTRAAEDHAQAAVSRLIQEYRAVGHLHAWINPFGEERPRPASLDPAYHGLSEAEMDRTFDAGTLSPDGPPMTLRQIVQTLEETYCGSIGVEVDHIGDREQVEWLVSRIEASRNRTGFAPPERWHILYQLYRAELFEKFCGKRYPGVKRFSLEGGESLIPMLDTFVERAGDGYDVREIVFGMSHRGRLNVLTNVVGKTYEQVFTEFEDAWTEDATYGGGDVKYHRGYSSNRVLPSGNHVWLAMTSNPSHLESVGPVVLGRCRAKQRLKGDLDRNQVIPLLIHGDAAFIGQGVVGELFNMSRLEGYTVGGTVHVVVNNLIGFTTGRRDARSSRYCTDMAKVVDAPVFHVNGEDPEACVHAMRLALDYRMRFNRDVVIDLVCYRRHGHNETDEAAFTQPLLYGQIKQMPTVLSTFTQRLVDEGVLSEEDQETIRRDLNEEMDRAYTSARKTPVDPTPDPGHRLWVGVRNDFSFDPVGTNVPRDALDEIAAALGRWPEDFTPHPKLIKLLEQRSRVIADDKPIDWATAEAFAIGSLLIEGTIVRLSGQDSRRGTFSQRHAAITDYKTGDRYVPLNGIRELGVPGTDHEAGTVNDDGAMRQAKLCVYDSPLSEFAVLGFEYGFSLASPRILALWEAQFGDFANGAQVIIDQFIASAEAKWHRWSGVTLLLPHGYEGQGPEHSSARIERFLKLCGQNNMQVCYPSTPAQYFHMLRRQVLRRFRKPLVVMTPKSLLRLPACVSSREDLVRGEFCEILDDATMTSDAQRKKVKRLLLCTGKVFYDLDARRREIDAKDVAIVRVEQVFPLHLDKLEDIVAGYPGAELVWVQEETKNAGVYGHFFLSVHEAFGWNLHYVGRPASGTPATGSPRKHREELEQILSQAVGPVPGEDEAAQETPADEAPAKAGAA